jgi:hypothetical protein
LEMSGSGAKRHDAALSFSLGAVEYQGFLSNPGDPWKSMSRRIGIHLIRAL